MTVKNEAGRIKKHDDIAGRVRLRGVVRTMCLAVFALASAGCGHTKPFIRQEYFSGAQRARVVGVEYLFDVNQFNYAPEVADEIKKMRCFQKVMLTHDIGNPLCDYVIRGDFTYSQIGLHNSAYYASIYMFLLPTLAGLPGTHLEGGTAVTFEVYKGGKLMKMYRVDDVFWEERSMWNVCRPPGPADQVRRLTRYFLKDFMNDFFGFKGNP